MLIDEHNSNILPLTRERIECALDRRSFGPGVDNEEVLLGVRGVGDVLFIFINTGLHFSGVGGERTPTPANRMPVTESCVALVLVREGLVEDVLRLQLRL